MKIKEIIILLLAIAICAGVVWYAFFDTDDLYTGDTQAQTEIRFEKDSLDLGRVKYNDCRKITFAIANIGNSPLLIKDVQPSCGCTQARWNKRPVRPGKTSVITLVFEPNSLGRFMKSIDVVCNTSQRVHVLKIGGEVEE